MLLQIEKVAFVEKVAFAKAVSYILHSTSEHGVCLSSYDLAEAAEKHIMRNKRNNGKKMGKTFLLPAHLRRVAEVLGYPRFHVAKGRDVYLNLHEVINNRAKGVGR